jgi:small-conductance mechanosensitive channel
MTRLRPTFVILAVALACMAAGPTSGPAPKPQVDLSTVALKSAEDQIELRKMRADATADRTPGRVRAELPAISAEIDAQAGETDNLLPSHPSLQVLDELAQNWDTISHELEGWHNALERRRDKLHDETKVGDGSRNAKGEYLFPGEQGILQAKDDPWRQTQEAVEAIAAKATDDEARNRLFKLSDTIADTRQEIEQARADLQAQWLDTLDVLADVDEQQAKVAGEVEAVRAARDDAWNRLFERDGVPVWELGRSPAPTPAAEATAAGKAVPVAQGSFARQDQAVRAYVRRHHTNVGLHVGLIVILAGGLGLASRWVRRWVEADPSLKRATLAFTAPVATALVLSLFAAVWIYPQAPRLFWAGLGAVALVPTVYLLRRVVERRLFVIMDAMVVFYFIDQVRLVTAGSPLITRCLFLAEMLGGTLLLALLLRARRDAVPASVLAWVIHFGIRALLATFAGCLLLDLVGYVSLAELVGGAALGGGYAALILYACTRVVGGLLVLALRSRPLTLLNGVRRHQPLLLTRLTATVEWTATAIWGLAVLGLLSATPAVFAAVAWFWHHPVSLGSIEFTPAHILVMVLTVWGSFLVSRFVQFVLDEDVYVHIRMDGGLSYAINRIVHYAVMVAGVYLALAAAGVQLTQLSLIVGALTVGLGFGLQNVVNNFVSGLILLFERPIKVGDLIQMSDATVGTVTYIGIRASVIHTPDGSEVIVPNGNLISNQLTNWTGARSERGITIPLSLGADAEPARVMELLTRVAAEHPLVVTQPRPTALLTKFAADAFNYELRAWTNSAEHWAQVRSDLAVSLHAALVREGIAIK